MTRTQRLKRVFAIDIETCPKCGGKLRVIAYWSRSNVPIGRCKILSPRLTR